MADGEQLIDSELLAETINMYYRIEETLRTAGSVRMAEDVMTARKELEAEIPDLQTHE
jgi:hypothetical protein